MQGYTGRWIGATGHLTTLDLPPHLLYAAAMVALRWPRWLCVIWLLALVIVSACGRNTSEKSPAPLKSEADAAAPSIDLFADATVTGIAPPAAEPLQNVIARLRIELEKPNLGAVESLATQESVAILKDRGGVARLPLTAGTLRARYAGRVSRV